MAKGRMINKKISNSKRVNDLPLEAALLYTWLIPHLDCDGVFYGNARMIKNLVFPRQDFSEKQVEKWLNLMENSKNGDGIPLIYRYLIDGEQLLWMPGFEGEQTGLRKDKEKPEFKTPPSTDKLYGQYTEILRNYYNKPTPLFRKSSVPIEVEEEENKNKNININLKEENKEEKTQAFGEIMTLYENNIGMATPLISDKVKITLEEYSVEWIKYAIEKSTVNEKRSWGYVEAVLKGWKRDGFNGNGKHGNNGQKLEIAKGRTGW